MWVYSFYYPKSITGEICGDLSETGTLKIFTYLCYSPEVLKYSEFIYLGPVLSFNK